VLDGALGGQPVNSLIDTVAAGTLLPLTTILGPAVLGYLSADDFRPVGLSASVVEELPVDHADVHALELLVGPEDAQESSIGEVTSPVFAVRESGRIVAAAGYCLWPSRTAHICVLTASPYQGRGLAKATSSAAVAHALEAGLLPQWRARLPQSRKVASALGFRELGAQLSVEIGSAAASSTPAAR
jgi:GNAT superfamily N-acetyltransferase